MLEAIELSKEFNGVKAVNHLNLNISAGEVFCLLGPNGAGKTTTINLILGFTRPSNGSVQVDGLDVQKHPLKTKRLLAYIPEQVMLYKNLTGLENLAYFTGLAGHDEYNNQDLKEFLSRAGLEVSAHERRVSGYSKGMRQKVGIALALAKKAKALLLDEPTSGLDPSASYEFSVLLRGMSEQGVAVLMATHDLFRAKEVGSRVGIMHRGRIVRELSGNELQTADLEAIYLEHMQGAVAA